MNEFDILTFSLTRFNKSSLHLPQGGAAVCSVWSEWKQRGPVRLWDQWGSEFHKELALMSPTEKCEFAAGRWWWQLEGGAWSKSEQLPAFSPAPGFLMAAKLSGHQRLLVESDVIKNKRMFRFHPSCRTLRSHLKCEFSNMMRSCSRFSLVPLLRHNKQKTADLLQFGFINIK